VDLSVSLHRPEIKWSPLPNSSAAPDRNACPLPPSYRSR
jgi:hypothetical protein